MPNSANKSNSNRGAGKGQPKDRVSDTSSSGSKPNPERSDLKQGRSDNGGDTGRTSNQGRKQASGGSANE